MLLAVKPISGTSKRVGEVEYFRKWFEDNKDKDQPTEPKRMDFYANGTVERMMDIVDKGEDCVNVLDFPRFKGSAPLIIE